MKERYVAINPPHPPLLSTIGCMVFLAVMSCDSCHSLSIALFEALLLLRADPPDAQDAAVDDALERLTAACWEHAHGSIAATHAAALLHKYSQECADWTAVSPQLHAFGQLLLACGPAALQGGRQRVFTVVDRCAADAADYELRMAALQLVAGMFTQPELAAELGPAGVSRLLEKVVVPCLPWRVGAAAAAVRSAAIATLTTTLDRNLVGAAAAAELIARQRLLAHLFSALGDSASTAVKTAGLAAIRLLLATIAGGGACGAAENLGFESAVNGVRSSGNIAAGEGLAHLQAATGPCSAAGSTSEVAAANGSNVADGSPHAHDDIGRSVSGGAAAGLSPADWGMAAKKLGKRLEDDSDAVRIAACDALAQLMRCRCAETHGGKWESIGGGDCGTSGDDAAAMTELRDKLRLHASDESPAVGAAAQRVLDVLSQVG